MCYKALLVYSYRTWVLPTWLCGISLGVETIGKSAGTLFIMVLALDRCIEDYFCVVNTHSYMQIRSAMSADVVTALSQLAYSAQLHNCHLGDCVPSRCAHVRFWYDKKERRAKVKRLIKRQFCRFCLCSNSSNATKSALICLPFWPNRSIADAYMYLNVVALFLVPVIVIVTAYVRVCDLIDFSLPPLTFSRF